VSFATITLCVASQRVFIIVVVYFIIDSVRKLLDTPSYIHYLTEVILPSVQNIVGICKQITIIIFYYVSYRLVTFRKFIYASIHISHIFVLTVRFKLINLFFQIFPPFVAEGFTGFASYIIQIISNSLTWILQPLQFSLLPFI